MHWHDNKSIGMTIKALAFMGALFTFFKTFVFSISLACLAQIKWAYCGWVCWIGYTVGVLDILWVGVLERIYYGCWIGYNLGELCLPDRIYYLAFVEEGN